MKKLMIAVVVLVMGSVCNTAMARDVLTEKEKVIIMKAVKSELKDPESARFKWPKLAKDVDMKSDAVAINYCGLVNAKNSYGGYVGDRPFNAVLTWSKGRMDDLFVTAKIESDINIAVAVCSDFGYADLKYQ